MSLVRFLLVVGLTLAASLSGAIEAGHMPASAHDHTAIETMADDQPGCCQDRTERSKTCHAMPALLPTAKSSGDAPATGEDVFCASGTLLTGIEPSGPLDPPRIM